MAYVPSESLGATLERAKCGIWFDPLVDGRTALVCKIPETAIKALYRGASASFLMAGVRVETLTILCLAIWIDDEPDRPFKITMVNFWEDDRSSLSAMLQERVTTLHCMNELNHPALSAACSFDPIRAEIAAEALRSASYWTLSPSSMVTSLPTDPLRIVTAALDQFQRHIHRSDQAVVGEDIAMTAVVPMTLAIWKPAEIIEVTPTAASAPFLINDQAEGAKLEFMIQAVLELLYPGQTYVSPGVQDGKISRELADALAFDVQFICVVQAKALAALSVGDAQPSTRRVANVERDIKKGLKQLSGAMSNLRSAAPIFTQEDHRPITVPNRDTLPAHAILVLSEMHSAVDWNAVAAQIAKASDSHLHRALFHVLDMSELAILASNANATMFSNRLMQRWVAVQQKGTAHMRTMLPAE